MNRVPSHNTQKLSDIWRQEAFDFFGKPNEDIKAEISSRIFGLVFELKAIAKIGPLHISSDTARNLIKDKMNSLCYSNAVEVDEEDPDDQYFNEGDHLAMNEAIEMAYESFNSGLKVDREGSVFLPRKNPVPVMKAEL